MSRWAAGILSILAVLVALGGFLSVRSRSSAQPPAEARPGGTEFAADRDVGALASVPFDARRAMGYLETLCNIGPRISGSPGMAQQQELLKKHFEERGARVEFQRFTARQQSRPEPVEMANLVASWHPEQPRRVILCAHYDTRPIADQEPDPRNWRKPFVSANDGGSGVALLMELAQHLPSLKVQVGVDIVLFDGEEYIFNPERDRYFFGSQHFADAYRRGGAGQPRYVAAVLLDMIGGKNARFPAEQHSLFKAGALVQEIWGIAAQLGCKSFESQVGPAVLDDHLALNQAGIPAIDIIDFDYPHWHKLSDVPANCSPDSLAEVARVLLVWLQRVR